MSSTIRTRRQAAASQTTGQRKSASSSSSSASSQNDEAYWSEQLEPLAFQMTHRKNDYGTILSLLRAVDPNSSENILTLQEADQVPREVGQWFLVEACERSVVRLGIGTNPGLKKYYWRANGSKRLLKREMEENDEADLVYIIQKAQNVSKRCASIPGTEFWLVMYLPSTLRSAGSSNKEAAAAYAAAARSAGPSSRKRRRTSTQKSSVVRRTRRSSRSAAQTSGPSNLKQQLANARPQKRQRTPTPQQVIEEHNELALSDSAFTALDNTLYAQQQSRTTATAVVAPTVVSVGPSTPAAKKQRTPSTPAPSSDADAAHNLDELTSLFGGNAREILSSPYAAPPPTTSRVAEPDPFLPLAGSQTSFSAVIEAAAMSDSLFGCGMTNQARERSSTLSLFDQLESCSF